MRMSGRDRTLACCSFWSEFLSKRSCLYGVHSCRQKHTNSQSANRLADPACGNSLSYPWTSPVTGKQPIMQWEAGRSSDPRKYCCVEFLIIVGFGTAGCRGYRGYRATINWISFSFELLLGQNECWWRPFFSLFYDQVLIKNLINK